MNVIDRVRRDREQAFRDPFEVMGGATSDDVSKYLPLAMSAITEVTTDQLKKKEQSEKDAAYKASDAGKAQAAAQEARKKAELARADTITEQDPNGPKHQLASTLDLAARSAEQKAAYLNPGQPGSTALVSTDGGYGAHGESFATKYKWPLILGGSVVGLGLIVLIARRK